MKNAIILHGQPGKEEYYSDTYPSASNFRWIPWLQKQLLMRDIHAVTPEMPHAYEPKYPVWKREFERNDVTPQTILVGHSTGGGFLVRWLSEHRDVMVDKVVLVAPFLDPDGEIGNDFFEFDIDSELAKRCKELVIFNGSEDDADIQESVHRIKEAIPDVKYVEFAGEGHFIEEKYSQGFPELRDELLK